MQYRGNIAHPYIARILTYLWYNIMAASVTIGDKSYVVPPLLTTGNAFDFHHIVFIDYFSHVISLLDSSLWLNNVFVSSCYLGLFGEGPADRRERLRQLLAALGEDHMKKQKKELEEELQKKDEVL